MINKDLDIAKIVQKLRTFNYFMKMSLSIDQRKLLKMRSSKLITSDLDSKFSEFNFKKINNDDNVYKLFLENIRKKKIEKKDEPDEEITNDMEIKTILENDEKLPEIVGEIKPKTKSRFINFFSYNSEYLSGSNYLIRMIIGSITIPIFFIGLLLISATVYKRSNSLRFGKILSIITSILLPILFSLSVVINSTQKILGESDDPLMGIVPFLFFIPHLFLIFKNGKKSL